MHRADAPCARGRKATADWAPQERPRRRGDGAAERAEAVLEPARQRVDRVAVGRERRGAACGTCAAIGVAVEVGGERQGREDERQQEAAARSGWRGRRRCGRCRGRLAEIEPRGRSRRRAAAESGAGWATAGGRQASPGPARRRSAGSGRPPARLRRRGGAARPAGSGILAARGLGPARPAMAGGAGTGRGTGAAGTGAAAGGPGLQPAQDLVLAQAGAAAPRTNQRVWQAVHCTWRPAARDHAVGDVVFGAAVRAGQAHRHLGRGRPASGRIGASVLAAALRPFQAAPRVAPAVAPGAASV